MLKIKEINFIERNSFRKRKNKGFSIFFVDKYYYNKPLKIYISIKIVNYMIFN
jgi:hypothetical protein